MKSEKVRAKALLAKVVIRYRKVGCRLTSEAQRSTCQDGTRLDKLPNWRGGVQQKPKNYYLPSWSRRKVVTRHGLASYIKVFTESREENRSM